MRAIWWETTDVNVTLFDLPEPWQRRTGITKARGDGAMSNRRRRYRERAHCVDCPPIHVATIVTIDAQDGVAAAKGRAIAELVALPVIAENRSRRHETA